MLLNGLEDVFGFAHAAHAVFAAGHIAFFGAYEAVSIRCEGFDIALCGGVVPHFMVHGGRDEGGFVGGQQCCCCEVLCEAVCHLGDDVGACRRDDDGVGFTGKADMAHFCFVLERPEVCVGFFFA